MNAPSRPFLPRLRLWFWDTDRERKQRDLLRDAAIKRAQAQAQEEERVATCDRTEDLDHEIDRLRELVTSLGGTPQ